MANKIVWILPSGTMRSTKKTPANEEKLRAISEIIPKTVVFFV